MFSRVFLAATSLGQCRVAQAKECRPTPWPLRSYKRGEKSFGHSNDRVERIVEYFEVDSHVGSTFAIIIRRSGNDSTI